MSRPREHARNRGSGAIFVLSSYYEQDGITIYHGKCEDVLPKLPVVDLVITDPPYSEVTHQGARTRTTGANSKRLVDFAAMDPTDVLTSVRCSGWLIATVDWRHMHKIEDAGLLTRFGIWVKPNGAPQLSGDRPATGWEAVAICWKGEGRSKWNGGGKRAVWTCNTVNAIHHPTEKPLSLIRKWIGLFGGECILDPFMGSGTTLVAAKMEGCRAIGIEIEEKYCETAANRLRQGVLPFAG